MKCLEISAQRLGGLDPLSKEMLGGIFSATGRTLSMAVGLTGPSMADAMPVWECPQCILQWELPGRVLESVCSFCLVQLEGVAIWHVSVEATECTLDCGSEAVALSDIAIALGPQIRNMAIIQILSSRFIASSTGIRVPRSFCDDFLQTAKSSNILHFIQSCAIDQKDRHNKRSKSVRFMSAGSNYSGMTDEELMLAYQQDDSLAFNEIYDRTAAQLYGYLRRRVQDTALVDDVFQATLFKFHQTRAQYRAPLPVLPWLFTICRTVMIDALRAKDRHFDRLEDVPEIKLSKEQTETSGQPLVLDGMAGMKKLTDQQKQALELRFANDMSFEDIATQLQTSPSNVRQLISRGLRKLKATAKKMGGTS